MAKGHAGVEGINPALSVSLCKESTIRYYVESGEVRSCGVAEGGEKAANNFEVQRTWIQISP